MSLIIVLLLLVCCSHMPNKLVSLFCPLDGPKTSSVSASPSAEIEIGKSLQLTCKGGANPAANYTWYKDNQTLPGGSKDIHQLASITLEDKGNYHCESKNEYGQINSTSVHIDVQCKSKHQQLTQYTCVE